MAIELLAIFAFTALIIFLARWGKEYIIKYGMYAVLSIALMYTMVPLAHMLVLDFETDPFVMESDDLLTGTMLGTWGTTVSSWPTSVKDSPTPALTSLHGTHRTTTVNPFGA